MNHPAPHLGCPYCHAYEVERLYLAPVRRDACRCRACGAEWDEDVDTRVVHRSTQRASAIMPDDS